MKTIILLSLVLLISIGANSQMVIGMGAGYILDSNTPAFNLQLGYTFGEKKETAFESDLKQNKNHLYYSQTVTAFRSAVPQIMAVHYGRNFSSFQPYIGYSYHLGSNDVKDNKLTGFYADYGITFYPLAIPWLYVSAGRSGKLNIISVGIYRVK